MAAPPPVAHVSIGFQGNGSRGTPSKMPGWLPLKMRVSQSLLPRTQARTAARFSRSTGKSHHPRVELDAAVALAVGTDRRRLPAVVRSDLDDIKDVTNCDLPPVVLVPLDQ